MCFGFSVNRLLSALRGWVSDRSAHSPTLEFVLTFYKVLTVKRESENNPDTNEESNNEMGRE